MDNKISKILLAFHDGHKVCGNMGAAENSNMVPLTLKDFNYDKEMRVRLKKTAPDVGTLQEDFEICGRK